MVPFFALPVKETAEVRDCVRDDVGHGDYRGPQGLSLSLPLSLPQANAWGLHDMHGNACEWTGSSYQPYPYREDDGRNDLDPAKPKTARGGSWRDRPKRATSSFRLPYLSMQKVFNVGFRVIVEE